MYTTLDTNAELQKQLGYIADDENSLKKVLAFVKELIAQQTKEHEMTKAEIMAEMKEAFRYAKAVQDKKAEGRPVEELLNEL
mgnify:CR=1 FL=1